jgi:hypothetical protein
MYQLTIHATQRIRERRLKVPWLLAALDGRKRSLPNGTMLYVDPKTRCALIINREMMIIVTALRLSHRRFKKIFQRRKPQWPLNGQKHQRP